MGRPSDWNSPTKALRLPEHTHDACLALAQALDNQPTGETYKKTLRAELIQLVRRHEPLLKDRDEWIDVITSPKYRKRLLREDVLNHAYQEIVFALAGHHTNEDCSGIFANVEGEEADRLLLLLLMELLSAVDFPFGGSVHQKYRGAEDVA